MDFTFCLDSLWALVGLSLMAFLWATLVYGEVPSGEKRKPEQEKDELGIWPEACSRGHSSRTRPHVRLVTIPLHGCSSPLQDEALSLLGMVKIRIAWRSPAEEWQMVFLAHGWDWTLFLLSCTAITKNVPFPKLPSLVSSLYSLCFLLKQSKQSKIADSV